MYNSDGYILIDLSSADMSKSNQYMPGLYHRVTVDCLGVNKLALVKGEYSLKDRQIFDLAR